MFSACPSTSGNIIRMCPSRFFKIASLIRSANFFLWTFFQTFRDLFKVYMMVYSLPLPSSLPRSCVNCNGTLTSEIQEEKREAYCTGACAKMNMRVEFCFIHCVIDPHPPLCVQRCITV